MSDLLVMYEAYDPVPRQVPWWELLLYGEPWIKGRQVHTSSIISRKLLSNSPSELEVKSVLRTLAGYACIRIYTAGWIK